jgi:hypothetical protein
MTAPVLSVTVPVTSAEFVAWPKAKLAERANSMPKARIRVFIVLPPN